MTGSFAASSANRLIFKRGENNRFVFGSSNQIAQADLLTLTTDIGLQYGSQRNGPITVNNSNLVVMAGESLSLLGGRVRVNGDRLDRSDGNNTSQLRAPQGQLTLIGMRRGQLESEDIFRLAPDRTGGELLDPGNQFANVDIRQQAGLFAGNPKGEGDGNAGIIDIRGNNVTVDGSDINTRNTQRGNVGLITMQAARNLQLQNDTLISNQATDRVVNLETIRGVWIIAPNGSVEMSESRVETDLAGGGSASRIRIEARDQIRLDRTTLTTTAIGVARGGGIRLRTNDIIARGSRLIASNESEIEPASEQQVDSDSQTMGLAGRIVLEGTSQDDSELERVVIRNSRLLTKVNEQAESNRIQINAPNGRISITGSRLVSRSSGTGEAGDIQIEANQVDLTRSQLVSSTTGDGRAGTIRIKDPQELTLADGSRLRSSTTGGGDGGNIRINAGNVTISGWRTINQNGIISISTSGLFSRSREPDSDNPSEMSGNAGRINVTADSLHLSEGGQISSSTDRDGKGGPIDINVQTLEVRGFGINTNSDIPGSGIFSRVRNADAEGNAGSIQIHADRIRLQEGGLISGSTFGVGNAGRISIETQYLDIVGIGQGEEIPSSGIYSRSREGAAGSANDIDIFGAESIRLIDGGQISTSVSEEASGGAGNISIDSDRLYIQGTSRSPEEATSNSTRTRIRSGIFSRVLNRNAPSQGGNIKITSDVVLFDDEGRIQANSRSESTDGKGGNIDINADSGFVIASTDTNSDIIASANRGRGGNIDITAQGIYGLVERRQDRITNDIDASSRFDASGNIVILTPGTDPSRSLAVLPTSLLTAEDRVDQDVCRVTATNNSRFISVGQGGLPPEPNEMFRSIDLWRDRRLTQIEEPLAPVHQGTSATVPQPDSVDNAALVEAQSWQVDDTGVIHLVIPAASDVPLDRWRMVPSC